MFALSSATRFISSLQPLSHPRHPSSAGAGAVSAKDQAMTDAERREREAAIYHRDNCHCVLCMNEFQRWLDRRSAAIARGDHRKD